MTPAETVRVAVLSPGPHPFGGASGRGRPVVAWVLSAVSGLVFLVCALLPLLQIAGEMPRGFEVRPVVTATAPVPITDTGTRVTVAMADIDEGGYGAVAPPRIMPCALLKAACPAMPRASANRGTMLTAPLDRPPRFAAFG